MIIGFVNGQSFRLSQPVIAANTVDYLEAEFTFQTGDWNGADAWAHFAKDGVSYDIQLRSGRIEKDQHLNLSDGVWSVYLHGTVGSTRITTTEQKLTVQKTGTLKGLPLPEIPISAQEQISANAEEAKRIAQSVRNDADAGKFDGEDGFSPSVQVIQTPDGVTIKMTDKDGTTSGSVKNGSDYEHSEEFTALAEQVRTDARNSASRAEAAALSATNAKASKEAAAGSAEQAALKASDASTSATEAQNSATAASDSATTAAGKATEATKAAETATTKAQESAASAEEAKKAALETADKISKTEAGNIFASSIKAEVSGEIIAVDDVSPIEHDVSCKVSSDAITDFTKLKITRTNAQLIPFPYNRPSGSVINGVTFKYENDGIVRTFGSATAYTPFTILEKFKFNGRVHLSGCQKGGSFEKYGIQATVDGISSKGGIDYGDGVWFESDGTIKISIYVKPGYSNGLVFKPMLSLIQSDYQVQKKEDFTPSSDGTVPGIRSVSPNMTLLTDTPDVVINAQYNADTERYIANHYVKKSAVDTMESRIAALEEALTKTMEVQ